MLWYCPFILRRQRGGECVTVRGQEAYFIEEGSMNDSSDVRDFKAARGPGIIGAHSRHLAGGLRPRLLANSKGI